MRIFFLLRCLLCLTILLLTACQSRKEELHVFIWGDYVKPELINRFEREYNCRVVIDTYDSNESMYAKLKLGAKGYDLIFPSNYLFELMLEQRMLLPLDPDAIPNAKNIDTSYLMQFDAYTGNFGIPFAFSNTGIAYRQDKVRDFQRTWNIFSRGDLRGRMTMLNDIRESLGAALKFLGYSLNSISEIEIEKAADQLIKWKRNLAKFESEQYKNGIASAEYLVVQGYSGDILQIMQENEHVAFGYPEEGIPISFDYIAIPQGAANVPLANKFINYLLQGDVAAENMEFTFYLHPNTAAYDKLPLLLRDNKILFPPHSILEKSEVIKNLGSSIVLYNKAWDRAKSAN